MRRIYLLAASVITVFLGLGCGGSGDGFSVARQGVPENLAGLWTWKIDDLLCPVPGGFLTGSDGDEIFVVSQNGNDLTANFVDSAGNSVSFSGTIAGENVSGTFTITEPGTQAIGGGCLGKGYVVNTDSNTVSVFDLATNTEITTIPVGSEPRGLDITPDGALVFVPNRFSDTVSVIRTSDDTVIKTIPVTGTGEPYNLEVTPDGTTVYVVNKNGDDVSVLDVATLTELRRIPLTGSSPEGLVITPDGARVFVVNRGSNTVDVIETATQTVVVSGLSVPSSPRDATVLPDGSKVYVIAESGLMVLPGTGVVGVCVNVTGVRGRDIVASPDGSRVFVASGPSGRVVHVVDTATDTLIDSIDLSTFGSYGIDICADGTFAYVSNDGSSVAVVDLVNKVEVDTFSVSGSPTKWVKLLEIPPPQVLSISFSGIARFNPVDSMLDGDFQVVADNLDACLGANLAFWIFINTGEN